MSDNGKARALHDRIQENIKLRQRIAELSQLVFEAYFEGWEDCEPKRNANQGWDRSDTKWNLEQLRNHPKEQEQ